MTTLVYEDFPGTSTEYKVNFEYIEQSDVKVGSITEEEVLTPITTGWSWKDETTIKFDSIPGGTIRVYRVTDVDEPVAVFYPTVAIRAVDLNNNFDQCLFRLQELGTGVGDINSDIDDIREDIDAINDILLDLSGIEILADVAALNAYDPPDDSVGGAVQVSNSTGWSGANNVTGSPAGFTGASDLRVNLRITNDTTPTYAFISYSPVSPDDRYVNKSGDTMTGPLVLSGAPTADLQASTKKYVDDSISSLPSDLNTTYDFGAATSGSNVQLQLVGSDTTTDVVTITPGSNITITGQTATGFTINAAGSAIPGTGNVTITAGTGLTGGGTFNVNQSDDVSITLNATGSGSTNLGWSSTATNGTVSSDTGTNATLTVATTSAAGLMSAADKTTFDAIPSTYQTQAGMSSYYTITATDNKFLVKDFSTLPLLP